MGRGKRTNRLSDVCFPSRQLLSRKTYRLYLQEQLNLQIVHFQLLTQARDHWNITLTCLKSVASDAPIAWRIRPRVRDYSVKRHYEKDIVQKVNAKQTCWKPKTTKSILDTEVGTWDRIIIIIIICPKYETISGHYKSTSRAFFSSVLLIMIYLILVGIIKKKMNIHK